MSVLSLSALSFAQAALAAGVRGGQPARFRGPEVDAYLASVGLHVPFAENPTEAIVPSQGYPWCAAFVYWCFEQAVAADATGIAINPCPRTAGALKLYERAPLKARVALPAPGDVFVLSKGGGKGHVGFVVSCSPDGQTITTCEGDTNAEGSTTGDTVGEHTWEWADGKRGHLLGFLEF